MDSARGRKEFEEAALPHLAAVHAFASSLTRNAAAAEDLVQDTFLHGLKGFASFRSGTNCKAWLFKICKNLFIDEYRSLSRRPRSQGSESAEPARPDPELDQQRFEQAILARGSIEPEDYPYLFGDDVQRCLKELPEEFRRALLLSDVEDFTYEEIATIMDTPIGTVRSRISRGRGLLRERLEVLAGERGLQRHPSHPTCRDGGP